MMWFQGDLPESPQLPAIRACSFFGSQAFREELLAQMNEKRGVENYGQEIRESAEAKAERIVKDELKKHHWDERELTRRRKGDTDKVKIAQRLRKETTMTSAWIAARLQMGTKSHLSHLLYWHKHEKKKTH